MSEVLRTVIQRGALSLLDKVMTHPILSWSWSGSSDIELSGRLTEFRPVDGQTVAEMMDGKYQFAGTIVHTRGVSPFAIDRRGDAWFAELHSFDWLCHFSKLRDGGQQAFARTLVLDWIGRNSKFDADTWAVGVTSKRLLNWLKSYDLLTRSSNADQKRTINRSIAAQAQSLKARQNLAIKPTDQLYAHIALLGIGLCQNDEPKNLGNLVTRVERAIDEQFDMDGLHQSRNPEMQIAMLCELMPVVERLKLRNAFLSMELARRVDLLYRAFDALTLSTIEPVFMNGCGQLPLDLVLAIASKGNVKLKESALLGGYGILQEGQSRVVADSGRVPPVEYAQDAHAGSLSFEFACGGTLICGNCGPAPEQLPESKALFRHSSAHSAPTIDDISSADFGSNRLYGEVMRQRGAAPVIYLDGQRNSLELVSPAYRELYGLDLIRNLTLTGGGLTLVGQDRFEAVEGHQTAQGEFCIRFHLAPDVLVDRSPDEDLFRIVYKGGESWAFIWEGAHADLEESVRHSMTFGLVRTQQIVLSGVAHDRADVAWVFTQQ